MTTRRTLLMMMGSGMLAGCTSPMAAISALDPGYRRIYAALDDEPFAVPAVELGQVDPKFWRREVSYPSSQPPGTVIVDPGARYAYLVTEKGRAIRYGVGVGKEEAFNFRGSAVIGHKAKWPGWTPTANMIRRQPERYARFAGGLPGGVDNPLGARALYLYRNGQDTFYRLHGTVEPWTIGTMVSSGCVRFLNQDIIDLYRRVPNGSRVVVLPTSGSEA